MLVRITLSKSDILSVVVVLFCSARDFSSDANVFRAVERGADVQELVVAILGRVLERRQEIIAEERVTPLSSGIRS